MRKFRSLKLEWLHGRLGDVAHQLAQMDFVRFGAPGWQPAINAFRCPDCIRICVDLAGVDKSAIDLRLEPQRVTIRGTRSIPEPLDGCAQILAMEIDYGPFQRELTLPVAIDVDRATARQLEGFLWIELPTL